MSNSNSYLPYIDGLRALAILPVVFYHAGLAGFSGGYVGVDIFFVISGFLITKILTREIASGKYSIIAFYERRARRLFPALFVMIGVTAIVAYYLMLPQSFAMFGRTAIATVFFVSNILFWRESSNYFDGPTEMKPFLHTWSLAVEEQYYILFPLLLFLVHRWLPKRLLLVLIAIALVSFLISSWGVINAPTSTFYLAPARAWELMLGGVLAIRPVKLDSALKSQLISAIGLSFIIASVVFMNDNSVFPGPGALLPCFGAAMIILTGNGSPSFVHKTLSLRPLVFIGLLSYSWYLWHWPLFVLVEHYVLLREPTHFETTGLVIISFGLAWLSWKFIELPVRDKSLLKTRRPLFTASGLATLFIAIFGYMAWQSNGLPNRFPNFTAGQILKDETLLPPTGLMARNCFLLNIEDWKPEDCVITGDASERVLLWGDSYAAHLTRGFELYTDLPFDILQYTSPRCPPILSYSAFSNPLCEEFNARLPVIIEEQSIDTILLAAKWVSYFESRKIETHQIQQTVATIRAMGVDVLVIGQVPIYGFDYPDEYVYTQKLQKSGSDDGEFQGVLQFDSSFNENLADSLKTTCVFDPLQSLCNSQSCRFTQGGHFLVADSGHLTSFGSKHVVDEFIEFVDSSCAF